MNKEQRALISQVMGEWGRQGGIKGGKSTSRVKQVAAVLNGLAKSEVASEAIAKLKATIAVNGAIPDGSRSQAALRVLIKMSGLRPSEIEAYLVKKVNSEAARD